MSPFRFLSTCLLILSPLFCLAQKIDEAHKASAMALKAEFEEASAALLNSKEDIVFFYDDKENALRVRSTTHAEVVALESNVNHFFRDYFSDESAIESYDIENYKGRNFDHDKYCGHYEQDGIFYSDAQICAYKVHLNLMGEYVHFQSTKHYKDPKYLTHIYFHEDLPNRKKEIKFTIPKWADIELKEINFEGFAIEKKVEQGEAITYTYTIENLASFPTDAGAPGHLLYLPHILVLTKSYTQNGQKVNVLSSVDDLYGWYASLTRVLPKDYSSMQQKVTEITSDLTGREEKIKAIFYWVQDNIKYIAFEDGIAGFKPESAEKVFFNRYGDCKGMANLCKAMLSLAGFDARLTWIGTNRIPYTYEIPSLAVDNHMVCTVFEGGKEYILDATEKYNPFGFYAERIQGKQILIENGQDYLIKNVPVLSIDDYLQENNVQFSIENGQLKGNGSLKLDGEYKKDIFNIMEAVDSERKDLFFRNVVSGNAEPDAFTIASQDEVNRDLPFSISYEVLLKEHMNSFGKELYVDLDFEKDFGTLKMEEERKIPYDFGRKINNATQTTLEIPSGYQVEYLPPALILDNELFSFHLKFEKSNGKITYTKQLKVYKSILPVTAFEEWNGAVKKIKEFYNDQIILKEHE